MKTKITKSQVQLLLFKILLSLLLLTLYNCKSKNTPPNVIIFFTDDQGYSDVGCYGAEEFTTPNFDKMALNGIQFTNFYAPATVSTPSRAGLLTGQYPKRSNLHEAVIFPYSTNGLPPNKYTMAEMFKENGYSTTCIGKWHLGHLPKFMPNNQGFDYFYGVPYSNDMDNVYYKEFDYQAPPLPLYKNKEVIERGPDQRYLTKKYTHETTKIIKNRGNKPFFIYLAHNMPHRPLHVSEDFEGISQKGLYGDVIMELDWSIGEIIKVLKEEGIYENTILLFTSDNGPISNNSAKPLRGRKATTWEAGQRVPAIITWPNKIPPNTVCDEMITSMDLFPTFCDIIKAKVRRESSFDGISLKKLLIDPFNTRLSQRPFFYYSRNGDLEAVRYGKWKLHIEKSLGWNTDEEGNFPVSLFNLEQDIGEESNIATKYPEIVKKLNDSITETNKYIFSEP